MHLGLIDGLFVPHNVISNQEVPVPLLKFQMAPRPKILMSSGSKKGTPDDEGAEKVVGMSHTQ
jgi:hypothetical protein